jgi:hypothetical protein
MIHLTHRIDTFHDGRRVLSLLLILHSSGQGDIPLKRINADGGSSHDSAYLLCHSTAKNAGNGLNTSFDATHDCGKLKHGFLDPALNLDLKLFDPDRHVMDGFDSTLDPIYLPMNRLDDTFEFSRDSSDVATDRSNLEAHRIDQFLCFMGCPTDLEKNRDEEDEDQNQDCRNDGNTDGQ